MGFATHVQKSPQGLFSHPHCTRGAFRPPVCVAVVSGDVAPFNAFQVGPSDAERFRSNVVPRARGIDQNANVSKLTCIQCFSACPRLPTAHLRCREPTVPLVASTPLAGLPRSHRRHSPITTTAPLSPGSGALLPGGLPREGDQLLTPRYASTLTRVRLLVLPTIYIPGS